MPPQLMTPEQIAARFPRVSKSTLAANAGNVATTAATPSTKPPAVHKLRTGSQPNAKEADFGLILEAMKQRGDIEHYAFEGISLRWGDGMRFTADWTVFYPDKSIKLIEIKGRDAVSAKGKVHRRRDDAIVRFKGCAAEWKERFQFEMWEKREGSWSRIW